MSWSFSFKGQKKAVRKAVTEVKNGYDVNSEKPEIAMEGRHVESIRAIALELLDRVQGDDAALVTVEANGSEWQGGGEAHVKVFGGGDLLMNPPGDPQKA